VTVWTLYLRGHEGDAFVPMATPRPLALFPIQNGRNMAVGSFIRLRGTHLRRKTARQTLIKGLALTSAPSPRS
jgi:hypothetical protein